MNAVDDILALVEQALELIPDNAPKPLPPSPNSQGEAEFHSFENSIWRIGEKVRQALVANPKLRSNSEVQSALLKVATAKNAARGRQAFIMCLESKKFASYAPAIASQLNDPGVNGNIISALLKMQVYEFGMQVKPFTLDDRAWVRDKAKTYVARCKNVV